MKSILVTGANSFVGNAVKSYLDGFPEKYTVSALSLRDGTWRAKDFTSFDCIYHVAGLAHSDTGNLTDEDKEKYYAVNTELTAEIARKAKSEGVKQFIFMSSAIVYGDSAPIGHEKMIRRDTACAPANCYGDSKLQAEKKLQLLCDDTFKVVILRCPMIYGKGGKGNFPVLEKLALKLPVFPKVENKRSMLYVGNLAEYVRLMIENEESGIFWPCNKEWSNTSALVQMIAEYHGKRIALIPGFTWALKLLSNFSPLVNKAFGSLAYGEGLGDYKEDYRLYSLEESIKLTEK